MFLRFLEDTQARAGTIAGEINRKDAKGAKIFALLLCVLRVFAVIFRAGQNESW